MSPRLKLLRRRQSLALRVCAATTAALIATGPCYAMNIGRVELNGGYVVTLNGEILQGDLERIGSFFAAQPSGPRFIGFSLDSPGGNLFEAEKIAEGIHRLHTSVVVLKNSMCASACFLLFAASERTVIEPGASIGVHSASLGGKEDLQTMGMTTAFARDLAVYGVAPDILGQLVTTTSDQMQWLTIEQLQELGTKFLTSTPSAQPEPQPQQAFASNDTAPPGPPAPPVIPPTKPSPQTAAVTASIAPQAVESFSAGLADRKAWEAWIAQLPSSAHQGAEFWASQRSLREPEPCEGQPAVDQAWLSACNEAKSRLAESDLKRHLDPLYRAGWNSL